MTKSKVNYKCHPRGSGDPAPLSSQAKSKRSRSGIAIIIAMIFMVAFLTISTTIHQQAMNVVNSRAHSGKSEQARYNAESAAGKARMLYYMPEELDADETLASGGFKQHNNAGTEKDGQYRITGVSGSQGKLSTKIGDWNVYPFPGSGTAGRSFSYEIKPCDVYDQIAGADDKKTKDKYKALLDKYGITNFSDFGLPVDFSCSWNKVTAYDSAIEIPLFAVGPKGEKIWLKFDEIKIRVRTACDEKEIAPTDIANATLEQLAEKRLYDATGMCEKEKRYAMLVDAKDPSELTKEEFIKNTVLNWGIYSDKGDFNYLIPLKEQGKIPKETGDSNIHTKAINNANPDLDWSPPNTSPDGIDFVVLDGNTPLQAGFDIKNELTFPKGTPWKMVDALNQSIKSDLTKPQISNPILRFTVEQKFKDDKSKFEIPTEPLYIPHLEYQILYKINENEMQNILIALGMIDVDVNSLQVSGVPIIIGEGRSGPWMHTVRMTIIEKKTGFDYVYQKQ